MTDSKQTICRFAAKRWAIVEFASMWGNKLYVFPLSSSCFFEVGFQGFFCSVLFGCGFLFVLVFLLGFPLLGIF